jgi:opacity protein-like surface antigen
MRGVARSVVLGLLFGTLCLPVAAHAAAFINPWGGVVFGNDQATTGFRAVGLSFGDAGHGLVGTETTVGIAPGFFGKGVENYVLDLMAGFTIGKTFKAKTDHDTRPYGLIEGGTIRTSIGGIGTGTDLVRNNIGLAVGGGTTVALNDRLLVKGEVRYIRAFQSHDAANSLNANLQDFHYWRTEFGIVIH